MTHTGLDAVSTGGSNLAASGRTDAADRCRMNTACSQHDKGSQSQGHQGKVKSQRGDQQDQRLSVGEIKRIRKAKQSLVVCPEVASQMQ